MSNPLKKIVSGVKKVFKKIVKVVKKVVSSKLFKVVAIAAAVYLGGAALGAWGSGAGSASAGGLSASAGASASGTSAGISITTAAGAAASGATSGAVSGLGTGSASAAWLPQIGAAAAGKTAEISVGKALLASTALNMGGSLLSGLAAAEAEKERKEELEKNNRTELNIYGKTRQALENSGWYEKRSEPGEPAMAGVAQSVVDSYEVSQKPKGPSPVYYDTTRDKWTPITQLG